MLTDVDILGGKLPLNNARRLALAMLIRRLPEVNHKPTFWPDIEGKIDDLAGADPNAVPVTPVNPTKDEVKGMALDAVLNRLRTLPGVVVFDEGTDKERTSFDSAQNWQELARDALDILFPGKGNPMAQVFRIAEKTLHSAGYRRSLARIPHGRV